MYTACTLCAVQARQRHLVAPLGLLDGAQGANLRYYVIYYTILYYTILYCSVLYCTVLYVIIGFRVSSCHIT